MARVAADPSGRLLTDSGFIDLHAKERAVFGDPWLFRMLVETGRIDPKVLIDRIDSGYYAVIATTGDLRKADYEHVRLRPADGPGRAASARRYDARRLDGRLFIYMKKERGPRRSRRPAILR